MKHIRITDDKTGVESEEQGSSEKSAEEIICTPGHKFYVEGDWIAACELVEGDILTLADGTTTKVTSVTVEAFEKPEIIYNFEVEDWHNYYVSENGVLVHNAQCTATGKKSSKTTNVSTTESPALKNSPYNPEVVTKRVKPEYAPNIAHNNRSSMYNTHKDPEPIDALDVYNNSIRGSMDHWYGINSKGEIYQFFGDNTEGVHFAGIISKEKLAKRNSAVINILGIVMKGKR